MRGWTHHNYQGEGSQAMINRRFPLVRFLALALFTLAGVGVAAAPAQASTAGCLRDNGFTMYFDYDTGNWKSRNSHPATGCGEVTVDWQGWSNTPDDCFYARVRTYRNDNMTLHPWRGPKCTLGLMTVLSDVPEGRTVRIEVKHASEYAQKHTIVPYLRWYF